MASGSRCPKCGGTSRRHSVALATYGIYSRRHCTKCGHRFSIRDHAPMGEPTRFQAEAMTPSEAKRIAGILPDVTTPALRARLVSSLSAALPADPCGGGGA